MTREELLKLGRNLILTSNILERPVVKQFTERELEHAMVAAYNRAVEDAIQDCIRECSWNRDSLENLKIKG